MVFEQYVQILFKTWYRHLILKHILSQFESSDSIHNLTNSISVLDAIYFIKKAWDDVSSDTIKNCFKKTGFREVNDEKVINLILKIKFLYPNWFKCLR